MAPVAPRHWLLRFAHHLQQLDAGDHEASQRWRLVRGLGFDRANPWAGAGCRSSGVLVRTACDEQFLIWVVSIQLLACFDGSINNLVLSAEIFFRLAVRGIVLVLGGEPFKSEFFLSLEKEMRLYLKRMLIVYFGWHRLGLGFLRGVF